MAAKAYYAIAAWLLGVDFYCTSLRSENFLRYFLLEPFPSGYPTLDRYEAELLARMTADCGLDFWCFSVFLSSFL